MRVGLLIDPIDSKLGYEENLRKAAELGFKVVQLWFKDIREGPGDVMKTLDRLGLELKSLAAYTDILHPERPWEEIFGELKEAVDYASSNGIREVVTESGGVPGRMEGWNAMIERLSDLARYGGKRGVRILIENGPGVLVDGTGRMLQMIEQVGEGIGINFDPANLNLVPDDVVEAVRLLGDSIVDTHAKDSILLEAGSNRTVDERHVFVMPEGEDFIHLPRDVKWVLPPVGEGDVPFPEYIAALENAGFGGDLIIEYQGGGNREEAIIQSRTFLENLL